MKEQKKKEIEDSIKDHLRGFSRTIPSFLMAYGNETITLANFDKVIPDEVFKEVTSISLDDFIFLRDGGEYTDRETGEKRYFEGKNLRNIFLLICVMTLISRAIFYIVFKITDTGQNNGFIMQMTSIYDNNWYYGIIQGG